MATMNAVVPNDVCSAHITAAPLPGRGAAGNRRWPPPRALVRRRTRLRRRAAAPSRRRMVPATDERVPAAKTGAWSRAPANLEIRRAPMKIHGGERGSTNARVCRWPRGSRRRRRAAVATGTADAGAPFPCSSRTTVVRVLDRLDERRDCRDEDRRRALAGDSHAHP